MGQLVWDASQRRDHAAARAYFAQAITAARQLRAPAAEGLTLLRTSFVAMYGEKDPKAGLALTMQTAETTKGTSEVITGLAVLHAAEAHAMLGQQADCEQALAQAEVHFGLIDSSDPAIELFSPTQHGRLTGSCYLFLNKARRAQPILEHTAQTLRDKSKSQAISLAAPKLAADKPFYLLDPATLIVPPEEAASSKVAAHIARTVVVDEMRPVDLIVCGSVTVNRDGVRLGKGAGYSDIEVALLQEAGLIGPDTTIVTTVHDLQIVDEPLPETEHDFSVDLIVTQTQVITCGPPRRPRGTMWDHLSQDKMAAIPTLAAMASHRN